MLLARRLFERYWGLYIFIITEVASFTRDIEIVQPCECCHRAIWYTALQTYNVFFNICPPTGTLGQLILSDGISVWGHLGCLHIGFSNHSVQVFQYHRTYIIYAFGISYFVVITLSAYVHAQVFINTGYLSFEFVFTTRNKSWNGQIVCQKNSYNKFGRLIQSVSHLSLGGWVHNIYGY